MKKIFSFFLLIFPFFAKSQNITTIAGNGIQGFLGDGDAAVSAEFYGPNSMAFDAVGNMYIVDARNDRIRKVNAVGIISEVAGNGTAAFLGDGAAATAAELDHPTSIAIDPSGNIYIGCSGDQRIRKINTSGIITTIAGTGAFGYNGDNIPATSAELAYPYVGATDHFGNLYLSDYDNHRVRKIDTSGIITTIAGNGMNSSSGDGLPATAASLETPVWLTISPSGDFYIPDNSANNIRKIDASGIITTIAGTGPSSYTGDGGLATDATFISPNSVAVDNSGNVYIADIGANVIRKINTSGIISTVAGNATEGYNGDNILATAAELNWPNYIAFNAAGNLIIADLNNNRIREIKYNTTGVNNTQNPQNNISIYPNPATNTITLISTTSLPKAEVEISNILGQAVFDKVYNSLWQANIDVGGFVSGVYLVRVNGVYSGRFVKE